MANDVEKPEVVDVEEGPSLANLAAWAHAQSVASGQGDAIVPLPDEKLPDPEVKKDPDEGQTEADKKAAELAAAQATEGRKVLKAKDGVHEIPYARLEESNAARDKAIADAAEAKAQAETSAKLLEEANAKLATLQQGADKGTTTAAAATQSADELEAQIKAIEDGAETLREESPWMADQQLAQAKTMRAMLTSMRDIQKELTDEKAVKAQAREQEAKTQQEQQDAIRLEITTALDAVPALRYWEKDKPAFYAEALRIDKEIRAKPEWQNKPFKERFEAVRDEVVKLYGESILPPGSKPAEKKDPPAKKALPDLKDAGIATLTDIPGGAATAQNPLEAVDQADPSALSNALLKMDKPADIIRWATNAQK